MESVEISDHIQGLIQQINDKTTAIPSLNTANAEAARVAAIKATQDLLRVLQTPEESVVNITYSPIQSLCLRIGLDLDVFNTLANKSGSVSLNDIAAVKKADPVLVERVLRILVGIGYINEDGERLYSANSMTRNMTDRLAISRVRFLWFGMPTLIKIPEFLEKINFRNPEGANNTVFNYAENFPGTIWDWFAKDPETLDITNTFMEADRGSRPSWVDWFPVQEQLLNGFDANQSDVLFVDMAGGRGHDIQSLRRRFPETPGRFILEDQPHVIDDVLDLDPSIEKMKFNLFDVQPIHGARVYYMKFILHDWSDDDSRKILRHIAKAMKKGYSKLIIEEFILGNTNCAMLPAMWDWVMMVFCNSMERTADQWTQLLGSAGFKVLKLWYPPGDGQGVIEAELE